jgi:hypothetical protein
VGVNNGTLANKLKCNPPGITIFSASFSPSDFASKKDDTKRKNGGDAIAGYCSKSVLRKNTPIIC